MSTIILIVIGIFAGILLLVGIGYLLDRYGVTGKVKGGVDYMRENKPIFKSRLVVGAIADGLIGALIILLIINF